MSHDLEARLRTLAALLPEPGSQATDSARRAAREACGTAPWATGRRRRWFSRGRRSFLLAAAVVLVVAGAALAATRWSSADLPPFGSSDREAFVLPTTDVLPGGYERTRPPMYADLPTRPSLLFPAGMTYSQAVARYLGARRAGRVVPPGVALADPLPAGKVAMVDHGRVRLDPAAPLGYSPTTGLVNVPSGPGLAQNPQIARCQLLLGGADRRSPSCDDPAHRREYVREGVGGRWIPSPNEEDLADPLVPASTQFSVLDRPTSPRYALSAAQVPSFPGSPRLLLGQARLALKTDRVALVAVPGMQGWLCLGAFSRVGGAWTCGPRATMFTRGVATLNSRPGGGRLRMSGFVGDGITRVTADDGTTAVVVNNAYTMVPGDSAHLLTFSGPVGTFTLDQPRHAGGPARAPIRSREREVLAIDLAEGGRASVRVAPNRGGGRCSWVYIKGAVRSSGCGDPSTAVPYDVVSGGFYGGGPGYPFVYGGQFAPEVGAVRMNFADGTSERLPLEEGFLLYEIPPERVASRDRWPVSVTTFDRQGVPLVSEPIRGFGDLVRQQRPGP